MLNTNVEPWLSPQDVFVLERSCVRMNVHVHVHVCRHTYTYCGVLGQVYPPLKENKRALTRLQERLIKKLGPNAHPFYFEVSSARAASEIPGFVLKLCIVLQCYLAVHVRVVAVAHRA